LLGEERDGKQRRQDGEGKARGAGVRWMSQGNGWLLVDCKRVRGDALVVRFVDATAFGGSMLRLRGGFLRCAARAEAVSGAAKK